MNYRLLIGGKLVDGSQTLDVINPATGKYFASVARSDLEQLNLAVAAAKNAFPHWSALPDSERRNCLHRFADQIHAHRDELARLLTAEQGKPLDQAHVEIVRSIDAFRHFADIELPVKIIRDTESQKIVEQRSALGVVAAITPWNFPVFLLALKLAPALSVGNTVVAKPAPTTPLTTAMLGEIAADIFPPGALNIVIDANDLGAALTEHPDVAKVSFTGSTSTGRRVMASAAETIKRVTLELGGNDAAIVLDDVDVKAVAPKLFAASMVNAGQVCLATKRIYAPRVLYRQLCQELGEIARQTVVGDGTIAGVEIGPVQNRQQYEKVLGIIEKAKSQGTVVAGGHAIEGDGYFIAPTVICDLPEDSELVRDEQFGPVIPVLSYDSIEEVIDRANDSEFGLGGTIWSGDVERGFAVALRIHAGTVWVNTHLDMPLDIPFGGAKQSGIGREQGLEGIYEFTQCKIINVSKNMG
jgi:acyl-CoA reductase-like NAD-dependent aldehyde dehydrogenase